MVAIHDIEKLRPELLDLSVAELDRRRAEIEMALAHKAALEESARRAALVEEAVLTVNSVVSGLKWLHAKGFLPQKIADAFTRGDGQFNPSTYIRAPRGVDDAPMRVNQTEFSPKRTRRVRLPDGTLVPSKSSMVSAKIAKTQ